MKLVLDLPEAFRENFQFDKFQDSFMRICGDIKEISLSHSKPNSDSLGLSGNYESELVDVLKTAFGKAVDLEQITVIKLPHAEELTPEQIKEFSKNISWAPGSVFASIEPEHLNPVNKGK